jgi:Arylsulfotransferase (ASST)
VAVPSSRAGSRRLIERGPACLAAAVLSSAFVAACGQHTPSAAGSGSGAGSPGDAGSSVDGSAPFAASLTTSPVDLTPAFSPDVHDYYVRCAAGTNALTVTATAGGDATVALLQPTTTAPAASQAADVSLSENEAVVVRASSGSESTEYWVRCLPHDFPRMQVVPHPEAGTPTPGYYLLGDTGYATGESAYAMVVDGNGVPVWYTQTVASGNGPANVESLAPNTVSFVAYLYYTFAETSGHYEVHSLADGGITSVQPVAEPLDLHELRLLPNGDYLVLSDPIVAGVDLTGLETFGSDEFMVGCDVQEVSPSGAVVWQWTATDHFDPVKDSTFPETDEVPGVGLRQGAVFTVDPFHCNSIDVDADGDLLISSRNMDSVFLVSRSTGEVVWKMGGSPYTKDGATYLTVTGDPHTSFYRQHDARFLPGGQISLFDDATDMPGPARGVVYAYDVNAGTATFVWQYEGAVTSSAMGSFRILPDGSRIVGWGEGGQPQLAFTETDAEGHDVLDFEFTDGDQSYRAVKVLTTQLDLALMRSSVNTLAPGAGTLGADGGPGADDGGTRDATAPAEPGAGCCAISGSGSDAVCTYSSSTAADGCAIADGGTAGSCPSTGLYGCCVETIAGDGGGQVLDATCYYSATTGQPAASECAFEAYQGLPYDWQTFAP